MQILKLSEVKTLITTKKLVIIDIFTTWCPPCVEFAERVEKEVLPIIQNNPNIVFVKLNAEDDNETAKWLESFGSTVVPTTVVFVNGKHVLVSYTKNDGTAMENAPFIRGNVKSIKVIIENLIKKYT